MSAERLVLKFEMPRSTEAISDFAQRFELIQDVGRLCLDRLPGIKRLSAGEVAELLALGGDVEGAAELLDMLRHSSGAPGLGDLSLVLKMDHVNVGESLSSMRENGTVPPDLLSRDTLRDLGRLAMFDLLLGNEDRFHEEKTGRSRDTFLNFENIDFRRENGRLVLVPLDNVSPVDLLAQGLDAFMAREFLAIGNPARRGEYAHDLVLWLCGELRLTPPASAGRGLALPLARRYPIWRRAMADRSSGVA